MTIGWIIMLLLIILNGVLAAGEVALVAISDAKVDDDEKNGIKKATLIKAFNKKGQQNLSAIQILHHAILFAIGIIFIDTLQVLNLISTIGWLAIIEIIGWALVVLSLYMVFGHMVPRRIAIKWTNQLAYGLIRITLFWIYLITPITYVLDLISKIFTRLFFNMDYDEGIKNVTEEEIRTLVEASGKTGVIDETESEMIHNIFDFDETTVDQIMTHRTEISAIPHDIERHELITFVTHEKFTRFPVYENDIDHIIGTLHVKDLLRYIDDLEDAFDLKSILRKAYYIPDSKRIRELFYEMKKSKNHIAIVIDEYGGTAGIITIEDMIEEIVGNIFDEYDEEEVEVLEIDENTYEIDGLASIDDIEDLIEASLPVDDYDTLSGFILGQLGRLPEENEQIEIIHDHFKFEVLEITDKVITKVLATRLPVSEDDES